MHSLIFRMANERDLEKSDSFSLINISFDYSGHFIVYPTMLGIKLVNIETNKLVKIIGKNDNLRPLHVALFQVSTFFVYSFLTGALTCRNSKTQDKYLTHCMRRTAVNLFMVS